MSISFNMSLSQQRFLAFAIKDFITTSSSNPHNNGEPCKPGELDEIIKTYVASLSSKAPVTKSRKLSPEQLAKRAEANLIRKEQRDRLKEEKNIAEKLAKAEAKAAKKAAAGPGFTVKQMTSSEGVIMRGINGSFLRVAKSKDTERGVWPRDTIIMKVPSNWSDSDKIEFENQFGKPSDVLTSPSIAPKVNTTNMVKILIKAAKPVDTVEPVVDTAETATTVDTAEHIVAPVEPKKPKNTDEKLALKKAKKAEKVALKKAKKEKIAEIKAKKAEKALELKAAELKAAELKAAELKAAELKSMEWKVVEFEGETKEGESKEEKNIDSSDDEFSEEDDDLPTEWTHSSYTGDETIFKDSDNGVYRFDDDSEDFEIIGFYYDEAQGDIEKDTLVLD
jgi:hypothetical protein